MGFCTQVPSEFCVNERLSWWSCLIDYDYDDEDEGDLRVHGPNAGFKKIRRDFPALGAPASRRRVGWFGGSKHAGETPALRNDLKML